MKRCPQCSRVEADEALKFCRVDGATLVSDSGSVSGDAGTAKFGSAPSSSEIETRVLPHATSPEVSHSTAPTTVLPVPQTTDTTRDLSKTRRRGLVLAMAGLVLILIVVAGYFYFSRKNNAAIQSIAVMPFVNASGNPDAEYISDGMTETLINHLSQLPKLSVKARSSVFRYKGKEVDPQIVGKELDVQAIVNGRVVQRGDDLTLYLSLVDTRNGNQLWGEQYNRKQSDLLSLQSEIGRDVLAKLRTKLSGADEQKLAKNYTANTEAYRLYLLGRFHWNKRTNSDFRKAIEYFQQAITADPNYALAYAGLADTYMLNSEYGGELPKEAIPKARETALKALSLDQQLSEAHTALGIILWNDYDFSGAEREYKRAIELDPNDATAHQRYGLFLVEFGKFEDGLAEVQRALEIEPFSLPINRSKGDALFYARRYDESIAQLEKTVALDANWATAYRVLSFVYWAKGDHAKSVELFAKYHEVQGRQSDAALERESFSRGGWTGFLRRRIEENRDPSGSVFTIANGSGFIVATCYAALGNKDDAFAALNKAYEDHENPVLLLKVYPLFDPLRDDPRFQELLKKVGFPQ